MSRPSKRTPELVEAVLARLKTGVSLRGACAEQGVHWTTWHDWEKADAELRVAREIARDQGMVVIEDRALTTTDPTTARVAMHRLGNLNREDWGTEQTITHQGMTLAAAVKARRATDGG